MYILQRITVKKMKVNSSTSLVVKASDTIVTLKANIQEMERIPVDQQQLIFMGKFLSNRCVLSDYNIKDGSILYLILKGRGTE